MMLQAGSHSKILQSGLKRCGLNGASLNRGSRSQGS
ncbi:hypothetical protein Gorai_014230 [Gossypium raimondii]|uniref:Uncharacterized protein n=1 Tax=Gossypium raimondii TaxID=29730 RepID=A0A7J8P2A7_GOSRA|nr:hypothetical protein [Gossypium raimondii]